MKEFIEAIREAVAFGDTAEILAICDRMERKRGRSPSHPWAVMEIGERFAVNVKLRSATVMASRAGKRYGRQFMARNEGGAVWILRVA